MKIRFPDFTGTRRAYRIVVADGETIVNVVEVKNLVNVFSGKFVRPVQDVITDALFYGHSVYLEVPDRQTQQTRTVQSVLSEVEI